MQISLFDIIQVVLLGIILVYLIYYVYTVLFDKKYQPKAWREAIKNGYVSTVLQRQERRYPDKVRFFNFWFQVERLKKDGIEGAFAELGVYRGESALLLHLMDPERDFHLFDTFSGFRAEDLDQETGKAATYSPRNFADTSIEKVRSKLQSDRFKFHQGYFPETTLGLEGEIFALVNMDADLYMPTKAGLEFFYPRLTPGGVLIVHDYNADWPGIMKAVDEYAAGIAEPLVVLPDQDNSVMLLKSRK